MCCVAERRLKSVERPRASQPSLRDGNQSPSQSVDLKSTATVIKSPNLAREPLARHWYASDNRLVQKFSFHEYDDLYRKAPGHFGARVSRLFALLEKGHYDVKPNAEDMRRLTLWLDCMSMVHGVYEKEGGAWRNGAEKSSGRL